MDASQMLAQHNKTWDMPTLAETAPEVIDFLSARYEVVFPEDFTGQVYVQHKAEDYRLEKMGTIDVRVAVRILLERAVAAEPCHAARTGEGYWTCDVLGGCTDCRVLASEIEDVARLAEWEQDKADAEPDPEADDPTRLSAGDGSAQRYFTETSL